MKKSLPIEFTVRQHSSLRWIAAFALSILMLTTAGRVSAQNVTLNFQKTKLTNVMTEISQQTGMSFAYSREVVDVDRLVSINVRSEKLDSALQQLFAGTGVKFSVSGKKILLLKDDNDARKVHVNSTVTGKIVDNTNTPVTGATVVVKGTSVGAITDIDGKYSIRVQADNPVLEYTFLGYETVEVALSQSRTQVDVTLRPVSTQINEVIVTALGVTRKEKSLGYAVSKIGSEELTNVESGNWLNGLSGKVAGLNMDTSSAGPAGSMRVTLRGEQSLSHDNNTALVVVDGVPINSSMDSNTTGSSYDSDDAPIDYGNGAGDLNADDIESVSVLKGPAATALYGSRAANGAVVITTKSGKKDKGLGITYSTNIVMEVPGFWPDFQHEYGSGDFRNTTLSEHMTNGITPDEYSFWTITGNKTDTGQKVQRFHSRYSYGEKFEGQMRYLYSSRNWSDDSYTRKPFVEQDWYKGFFRTGVTYTNSLAVETGDGKGQQMRISVKDVRNEWISPNTGYNTQNIGLSVSSNKSKYIKAAAKITYFRKNSDNLPIAGYNNSSPLKSLMWKPNTVSIDDMRDEYNSGRILDYLANGNGSIIDGTLDNPYLTAYEQLNTQQRDRVYGNVSVTGHIIPDVLTIMVRSGLDFNNDFRTQQKPQYSISYAQGMYREQTIRKIEYNNDFLISYKKTFGNFSLNASFGGNNMVYKYSNISLKANKLDTPNVYMLQNVKGQVVVSPIRNNKSINSFYGFASLSYRDMLFLDITGRNDWSSTLAAGNNSYFYPSVSASVLLDEVLKLHDSAAWIDMLKIRGSWANVGNDTEPYQLLETYANSNFTGSYELYSSLKNANLKPENVESWEVGLEAKMFRGKLGIDAAYYDSKTTNQIISVPTDWLTGAATQVINAGCVRNRGVELSANIRPVNNKKWKMTIALNWSKNWNELVRLAPNVDVWQLNDKNTIGQRVMIYAYPGTELGRIYGVGFERAPQGSFYYDQTGRKVDCSGEVIVDPTTGNPIMSEDLKDLGCIYPDWKAGMTLNLKYKTISLSMSFAASVGGKAYSLTNSIFSYMGKLTNSLEGRYDGLVHQGVNLASDGTYSRNATVTTDIVDYYNSYVWTRNNVESNVFDTSYLKMKELRISYDLPKKLCARTGFLQGVTFGFFVSNVFCISNWPQYDPEVASLAGSSLYRGVDTGSYPMTRSYGFNLKLKF